MLDMAEENLLVILKEDGFLVGSYLMKNWRNSAKATRSVLVHGAALDLFLMDARTTSGDISPIVPEIGVGTI